MRCWYDHNKSVKILFFSERAGVHERRFLKKLACTSYEVWFLPAFPGDTAVLPSGVRSMPPLFADEETGLSSVLLGLRRLRAELRQVCPDLIHAGPVTTCAFWAALICAAPLLVMSWNYDLRREELPLFGKLKNKFALRRAQAAVCDCEAVRQEMLTLAPGLQNRIFTFPWGVELDRYNPEVPPFGFRIARGWQSATVVLSTRTLDALHGIRTLVEAGIQALAKVHELRFVFVGDGPLRTWCEQRVREAGVEQAFWFLGKVQEEKMPGLFVESDLYVSASQTDGTSVSLLQALASGRPVAVSDLPGNREWIRPGLNGWLISNGSHQEWVRAFVAFSQLSSTKKKEFQQTNLALARERADWEKNFQTLLSAYEFVGNHRDENSRRLSS